MLSDWDADRLAAEFEPFEAVVDSASCARPPRAKDAPETHAPVPFIVAPIDLAASLLFAPLLWACLFAAFDVPFANLPPCALYFCFIVHTLIERAKKRDADDKSNTGDSTPTR